MNDKTEDLEGKTKDFFLTYRQEPANEIKVTSPITDYILKIGALHRTIDLICRNSTVTGSTANTLIKYTKELTHAAIMLEEEVTGKPSSSPIPSRLLYATYNLDSVIEFGKYKGNFVRDVIQIDPVYVMWAHDHVKKFKLPPDVVDALITVL